MAGVVHLLDASITSALALKPSTVYVLRVENSKTRAAWHLRKCFSEFCELREKVIALIDGTSSATSSSSFSSSPGSTVATSSSSSSTGIASSYDSNHTCSSSSGSESYLESAVTNAFSCASSTTSSSSSSDRFPFLYKQFPRRQLFGSRSKKVIEQRTHALNAFVRQLLLYVREVKQQNQIAVYFSMMNFVETFFECAAHSGVGSNNCNYGTTTFNLSTFSLTSPSTLAKTQAAAAVAARAAVAAPQGFRCRQRSPFSFYDDEDDNDDEDDSASDRDSDVVVAPADVASSKNNFNFARRFYQEYGKTTHTENDDDDSDDEETKLVLGLKKTASCIAHRELKEMKTHFSGSHYAPMQSTAVASSTTKFASGAAGCRKNHQPMSASDAWAARIEIAGFSTVAITGAGIRNAQVQNSSKLAIGANHVAVRHHPNHSSNKKKHHTQSSSVAAASPAKHQYHDNDQSQIQAASIVYATKQQHQDAKALMLKHKQLHAGVAAGGATSGTRRTTGMGMNAAPEPAKETSEPSIGRP